VHSRFRKQQPGSPFATDFRFVVVGADAGILGATTAGVPTGFPAFPMRVTKIWRTQLTGGTPATVNVSFDLGTGIYNSGIAGNYSLLQSTTPDFSAATPVTGGSISSNVITFNGVTLNDGDYFTLGLATCAESRWRCQWLEGMVKS